jgi:Nif-specific regulatory protein
LATEKHKLEDLIDFAKILGQQADFQEVLRLAAHKTTQFLNADVALILMLNPDTRETVKTIFKEGRLTELREYRAIHIHVGGWIIKNNSTFISPDIQNDSRFVGNLFSDIPVKAVLGVPLCVEGITLGALLALYKQRSESFDQSLLCYLENMAAIAAPFLRNVQKIKQYFHPSLPEAALLTKYEHQCLLGKSQKFRELLHAIEAAAHCDVRVLLEGKTGTGKELIARAIHQFSSRCDRPFVAIDCGAIPPNLMESELFGFKKGAFTGANVERPGLVAEADGGTLFMDEINNLPLEMQIKFMRVFHRDGLVTKGEVRPVGSNKTVQVDVRIIAASSRPLRTLVDSGEFREDLYFRLYVYPIAIPDLEERREDIPLLATHFLKRFSTVQQKKVASIHEEILDFIKQRPWPGNIRELENVVERLVTLTPPDALVMDATSFPADLQEELNLFQAARKSVRRGPPLREQLQNLEAQLIRQTLIDCHWNQSEAARRLQTSEKNIRYKMKKLNIKKS